MITFSLPRHLNVVVLFVKEYNIEAKSTIRPIFYLFWPIRFQVFFTLRFFTLLRLRYGIINNDYRLIRLVFYGSYFWRESKTLKLKLTLEVRHITNTISCTLFPAPLLLLKPYWFWSNDPSFSLNRLLGFMFQLFWNFELISVFLALISLLAFKSPL